MVEFSSWNSCPGGTQATQLYPGHSCYDKGVLGEDGDMFFMDRGFRVAYGEFCVAKLERSFNKGDVFIQACMPHKKITVQSFYIYILGTSILCLVLTMVIYITSPELSSLTNQFMFHLTAALLIAYLALIFVQNPELLEAQLCQSHLLCQSLGYLQQFSFLAAFTWMTIMSMENMNQLNGCGQSNSLQQSSDEIKKLMMIGYGVPLMLSLGTAAVELFAPECAVYKPRFGHRWVTLQPRICSAIRMVLDPASSMGNWISSSGSIFPSLSCWSSTASSLSTLWSMSSGYPVPVPA